METLKSHAASLKQIANSIENHECEGRQHLIVITYAAKHRQRLTPNFYIGEFMCRDGSTLILIDKRLAEGLQKIRDKVGKPVIITSAFRTPEHNIAVKGAQPTDDSEGSQHLYGKAADISVQGMTGQQLANIARAVGFTGIGIAGTWCHVDVRDEKAEWRY